MCSKNDISSASEKAFPGGVFAPLHGRTCTGACAFFAECMHVLRQVL